MTQTKHHIGLIVPPQTGAVPPEAPWMYPDVSFAARGLGLRQMSAEGYAGVLDRIVPAAQSMVDEGAEAICVMGTSLSFFRGRAFDEDLSARITRETGRPATTMAQSIVAGILACGMTRVAVMTAYRKDVNDLLEAYLEEAGITVAALGALDIRDVNEVEGVAPEVIKQLGHEVFDQAEGAEGLLISCGGLRVQHVTPDLRSDLGCPVVSSAEAGLWGAVRLVSDANARQPSAVFGPVATNAQDG